MKWLFCIFSLTFFVGSAYAGDKAVSIFLLAMGMIFFCFSLHGIVSSYIKRKKGCIRPGDTVILINDPKQEHFITVKRLDANRGPNGQYSLCHGWRVVDNEGGSWEFREDAIMKK